MWSVAHAKAHLSEILRRARAGTPQVIGASNACVVISAAAYEATANADHDGAWLIDQAARVGGNIALPSRSEDRANLALDR
jgi:prevent-host-death family protein